MILAGKKHAILVVKGRQLPCGNPAIRSALENHHGLELVASSQNAERDSHTVSTAPSCNPDRDTPGAMEFQCRIQHHIEKYRCLVHVENKVQICSQEQQTWTDHTNSLKCSISCILRVLLHLGDLSAPDNLVSIAESSNLIVLGVLRGIAKVSIKLRRLELQLPVVQ